ncbi:MAG: outer membrane beta-barrel protein [Burkholderiales bacterium]
MKKLLIASAVSALFAAPATVLAQAKAPTLDKVLEASGLSVSGYIDAGYTYSNRNIEPGNFSTRVFDLQNNSFVLHQAAVTIAKQPKEGFGGLVNLTMGKDAQAIHSVSGAATDTSMFDVTQAFAQYASGPLTLIAGKFATLHGTEVIASPGNVNISRSILFGSVPFTHTGVRGTFALSDTVSLIAGVNNGWDQLTDSNRAKTLEIGATLAPIKPLSIALSAYSGKEPVGGGEDGTKTSFDGVASYTVIDPLSVGLEVLVVNQDNVGGGGGPKQKYSGVAGYVTYMFASNYRGSVRVERLDDKDGFRFGTAGRKYAEVTVTGAYLASDSFELRGEARMDRANTEVFTDFKGATSKSHITAALQALYKF